MSESRKKIIRAFFDEVWNTRDVEHAGRYVADQYTIYHDHGDPWEDKTLDLDEFRDRLLTSCAPFPDQIFTIADLVSEGDKVVVIWTWKGTHKADLPGFPATGKVIQTSGMTVYYFKGDKLCGHWQVVDRLGIFQQLTS